MDVIITRIGESDRYRVEADGQIVCPSASLADSIRIVNEKEEAEKGMLAADVFEIVKQAKKLKQEANDLQREAEALYKKLWGKALDPEEIAEVHPVTYDAEQMGREK